jgi:transglutaminase-like putative cysteine protease
MNRKPSSKRILSIVTLVALLILPPLATATTTDSTPAPAPLPTSTSTLYLMRNENYLYLKANTTVASCHVSYVFPPEYQYQTPVYIEVLPDTTITVTSFRIVNDTDGINKLVTFTVTNLIAGGTSFIHFNSWALVNPTDFKDLPRYVRFPRLIDLPTDTWQYLTPSKVVQSRSIPIRTEAFELQRGTTNLIRYADHVMRFIANHHKLHYIIEFHRGNIKGQDAKTVLRRSGDCPGRAHLASALMRAHGVPARSIMVSQNNSFWVQMHFMSEYYCPGYGWILSQVHNGKTPTIQNDDLILRICTPTDEAHTVKDAIFPKMTGEERWFWSDNTQITLAYNENMTLSRQNMFLEGNQATDTATASYAMSLSTMVFRRYQSLMSQNLTDGDLQHYTNAVTAQHSALDTFHTSLASYLSFMNQAYQEYQQIA